MDRERARNIAAIVTQWLAATTFAVQLITRTAALYLTESYWSQPMHTSALSGQAWVDELISGHPDRMRINFGMPLHVFTALIVELRMLGLTDGRYISLEEKLGIFLYTCVTGLSSRLVGERFQRSKDTVTRSFRQILDALSGPIFYNKYVCLPSPDDPPSDYIRNNPKLWPFLSHCLGALDGTHILCSPSAVDRANMRNRKGSLSQNVLAVCDFRFRFVYVLSGWDGSQTDSFIYSDARINDFPIPEGYFYLGDAGFPQCPQVLVPYRGVRYHLREWAAGNQKPQNKKELFNLRHAQARNIVERIFGVLKNRWQVLVVPMRYAMHLQAKIPIALCALHNFILQFGGIAAFEEEIARMHSVDRAAPPGQRNVGTTATAQLNNNDLERGKELQNNIAEEMWVQYRDYCARHGVGGEEYDDDDDEEGEGDGYEGDDADGVDA